MTLRPALIRPEKTAIGPKTTSVLMMLAMSVIAYPLVTRDSSRDTKPRRRPRPLPMVWLAEIPLLFQAVPCWPRLPARRRTALADSADLLCARPQFRLLQ